MTGIGVGGGDSSTASSGGSGIGSSSPGTSSSSSGASSSSSGSTPPEPLLKGQPFSGNPESLAVYAEALTKEEAEHLLIKANFGGSLELRDQIIAEGLESSVDRMIRKASNGNLDALIENPAEPARLEVKSAWVRTMVEADNGLQERMSLILHDLFATSCRGATYNLSLIHI